MKQLPALCQELCLREEGGVPVVNSRNVAEAFDKRHDNVLRDIEGIIHSSEMRDGETVWFSEVQSEHPTVQGRMDRSFDLTRQGFTLLVMGWTGERAMTFKVRYIEAFDAMETALRGYATISPDQFIQAVREIVAPLAVRFDGQDRAIERVEARVDSIAEDMASVKAKLFNGRRNLSAATKREHVDAIREMGGRCPCCLKGVVVVDNAASRFAQFDHFYANSQPNAEHTWLICTPCHNELSSGKVPRDQREAEFRAYQNQRRRLPGRQARLF